MVLGETVAVRLDFKTFELAGKKAARNGKLSKEREEIEWKEVETRDENRSLSILSLSLSLEKELEKILCVRLIIRPNRRIYDRPR